MSTRKRTILSAAQKREICEAKEREPSLSNVNLTLRYNIGKSTVTDILSDRNVGLQFQEIKEISKNFVVQSGLNLKVHLVFGLIMLLIQSKILMVMF